MLVLRSVRVLVAAHVQAAVDVVGGRSAGVIDHDVPQDAHREAGRAAAAAVVPVLAEEHAPASLREVAHAVQDLERGHGAPAAGAGPLGGLVLHHDAVVVHRRVVLGAGLVAVGELVLHHVGGQVAGARDGLEGMQHVGQPVVRKAHHVVVHLHDVEAPGQLHRAGHAVEAHVLGAVDHAQVGMRRGQLVQVLPGAVGGGVVPDDDLEVVARGSSPSSDVMHSRSIRRRL